MLLLLEVWVYLEILQIQGKQSRKFYLRKKWWWWEVFFFFFFFFLHVNLPLMKSIMFGILIVVVVITCYEWKNISRHQYFNYLQSKNEEWGMRLLYNQKENKMLLLKVRKDKDIFMMFFLFPTTFNKTLLSVVQLIENGYYLHYWNDKYYKY